MMSVNVDTKPSATTSVPLVEATQGSPLTVIEITANDWTRSMLSNLGILPGVTVIVIQSNKGGPLLIIVKGSRVALGRDIASTIYVER
jgi:Fe2+ transport system protein FeoA